MLPEVECSLRAELIDRIASSNTREVLWWKPIKKYRIAGTCNLRWVKFSKGLVKTDFRGVIFLQMFVFTCVLLRVSILLLKIYPLYGNSIQL